MLSLNRRILIVDDNVDIHSDFRKILEGPRKKEEKTHHLTAIEEQLFEDEDDEDEEESYEPVRVVYEIDSAYQGEEAIDMVAKAVKEDRPYALIFMDVRMPPGIDGIETISRIWRRFPNVEIVICTAYSDYSFDDILDKIGTSDRLLFLTKPFDSIAVKQMALSLSRKWSLHEHARRHVLLLQDEITQRKKSEDRLQFLINHDPLTGLANRSKLQKHLTDAIVESRRDNTRFALFFIDLDRFREVIDTLGYQIGDEIIKKISVRLVSAFQAQHAVYRLGDDEFAILVRHISSVQLTTKIADQINTIFEPVFDVDHLNIEIHPNVGIVIFPDHGCSVDMLIRHADMTLTHARQTETSFKYYREQMNLFSPQRLLLLGNLRQAIQTDELMLYFQPKISLQSHKMVGVEALIRWPHAEYGFIPPSEFIPLAERCGLIKDLTYWVLKRVPRQWSLWKNQGIDLNISVNLTAQDLQDSKLPQKIREVMDAYGMPAERLGFEISEKGVMEDPEQAIATLFSIENMGGTVSIDNFGTGYSSLAYLKNLPVKEIKIDQSFVGELHRNENDIAIVRSMINLGHNLGLRVVAEGVSDPNSMRLLQEFGCDFLQGTVINGPIPAGELPLWLKESQWSVAHQYSEMTSNRA